MRVFTKFHPRIFLKPIFLILISSYFSFFTFASHYSAKQMNQEPPKTNCLEILTIDPMDILINDMAQLYLELFHGKNLIHKEVLLISSTSNQALWEDVLTEVELKFPGISLSIKSRINLLLPEHLQILSKKTQAHEIQKEQDQQRLIEYKNEEEKNWNICKRSTPVQNAIVSELGKSCDQITKEDLLNITTLDLSEKNITHLYEFDFWGLYELQHLKLNNNELQTLNKKQFIGLTKLQTLYLSKNKIQYLHENLFFELQNLQSLHLSYNQLESFHNNQFSGLIKLKFLFLNNNQIKSLNEHQFNHLQKLKLLYIQNNPLESNSISLILSYFKNKIGGVFKI